MKSEWLRKARFIAMLVMVMAGQGTIDLLAQDQAVQRTWEWCPPTTGSPVEFYLAQMACDTLDVQGCLLQVLEPTDIRATFQVPTGVTVWVRVLGVDADGDQGPWSAWSLPELNDGVPGPVGCRPRLRI